jgi:hypothetical protein
MKIRASVRKRGFAGVCFFHYSYDIFYKELLIIFLSRMWLHVRRSEWFFLESPKPC